MMWGRLPRWPLEGMIDNTIKREVFGTYTRRSCVHMRASTNFCIDLRMPEVHADTESRRDCIDVFDFIEEAQNCHNYEAMLSSYQLNNYGDDKKHLELIKFHKGLTGLFEHLPQFCWNFLDIPTLGNDTASSRYALSHSLLQGTH